MATPTRILIPIAEPIGGQMSAVGIRQLEIGKALAGHCEVTFASSAASNDSIAGVSIVPCRTRQEFRRLLGSHDVLYTLGLNADRFLDVARSGIRVSLDLYTPLAFEILESWPEVPTVVLERMHRRIVRWSIAQLSRADFVVCASEPQRDLWLGTMNAAGVLQAARCRRDPDCQNLIGVVPFGIPDSRCPQDGNPLRARLPNIGVDDFVLLWSSKVLAWQDPLTLLRAVHLLKDREPRLRLVFLGIGPAAPAGIHSWFDPSALRTRQTLQLANELGLTDRQVFFVTERIPYRAVGAYYRDADAGVATYPRTLETHFCLGSRLLDYVWAGLPMVVSGDELQRAFVEGQQLGRVVPPGDVVALAQAIQQLRLDIAAKSIRTSSFEAARECLKWSIVAEPVIRYCTSKGARSRQKKRRLLQASMQLSEFVARSLLCRASCYHMGIRKTR